MLNKNRLLILVLVLGLVVAALPAAAQGDDTLRIGLMVDQSGALTLYGFELEYGFRLGLQYASDGSLTAGGRPVEVLVRDNAGDPDTAVSQARELIEQEGVEVLVGAPSSGVTVALQQVALDYDVILMAAPGASPAITSTNFNVNTFRVCRNVYQDFLTFASYAQANLGQNFLQFAADYEFGRGSASAAEAVYGALGFNFVAPTIYAPLETTDFTPYIQQILDLSPDVLLPIWAGDGAITLFQQFSELGVFDNMAVAMGMNSNDVVATSDPSQIGLTGWIVYHYTFPQTAANDWLTEQYQAQYNDYPDLFSECSFATAQALITALDATNGETLPDALIPALEGMIFDGPKGVYGIRPSDHQALAPMYVVQLDNVDSPELAFFTNLGEVSALDIAPPCSLPEGMTDRCDMDTDFMTAFTEAVGGDMAPEATAEASG